MRAYRRAKKDGHKVCNRCNTELPATTIHFIKDSSRTDGLSYECKRCHSVRKKGRDRRKERWSLLTPEQKERRKATQAKYNKTIRGRACSLRKAYERTDSCDLTSLEIAEITSLPCSYCGTTERLIGLDRINNSLGHIKGNVLPACVACNFARGDRFSVEEMMLIGLTIKSIYDSRSSS